jgi:hypothetical protein
MREGYTEEQAATLLVSLYLTQAKVYSAQISSTTHTVAKEGKILMSCFGFTSVIQTGHFLLCERAFTAHLGAEISQFHLIPDMRSHALLAEQMSTPRDDGKLRELRTDRARKPDCG